MLLRANAASTYLCMGWCRFADTRSSGCGVKSPWLRDRFYLLPRSGDQDGEWTYMYVVMYKGSIDWYRQRHLSGCMNVSLKSFYDREGGNSGGNDNKDIYTHDSDTHVVQWYGSMSVKTGQMPDKPPLFYPAFLSDKDFDKEGNPKVIFKGNSASEACRPYFGFVCDRDLELGTLLFEDGSEPCSKICKRLTAESWQRVIEIGKRCQKTVSFRCES